MKKIFKLLPVLFFTLCVSCFDEPVDLTASAEDVIAVDSELYNLLERVVADEDPEELYEFTCVNFDYPFTLLIYDADLALIDSQTIYDNDSFSNFLAALDPALSISLSYPIISYYDNGDSVTINNNEELKIAIDTCIEEEFNSYCNNNLPQEDCIWEVNYLEQIDPIYDDAYFSVNDDGTVQFFYDDAVYNGTWVILYIEDETHLNINLLDEGDVGTDWNFDWLIDLTDDGDFLLFNGTDTFILHENCDIEEEESCDDLNFEACETEGSEGFAEFNLGSYRACILTFTEVEDPENIVVHFYETQVDAETDTNPLFSPYTNITATQQTLFVRMDNTTTAETTYVSITIEAVSCN